MGVYQKLLVVTSVTLKSCPPSKFVRDNSFWIGTYRLMRPATNPSQAHKSIRSKKHATTFGGGETRNISPQSFLQDPFGEPSICVVSLLSRSSNIAQCGLDNNVEDISIRPRNVRILLFFCRFFGKPFVLFTIAMHKRSTIMYFRSTHALYNVCWNSLLIRHWKATKLNNESDSLCQS